MLYVSFILSFRQKEKAKNKLGSLTPLSTYDDVVFYSYGLVLLILHI